MPPAPALVPFTDYLDLTWADETNPTLDVIFDDATYDGPNRLRLFVHLGAGFSGGSQPVGVHVRQVLGGAEACGPVDTSSAKTQVWGATRDNIPVIPNRRSLYY